MNNNNINSSSKSSNEPWNSLGNTDQDSSTTQNNPDRAIGELALGKIPGQQPSNNKKRKMHEKGQLSQKRQKNSPKKDEAVPNSVAKVTNLPDDLVSLVNEYAYVKVPYPGGNGMFTISNNCNESFFSLEVCPVEPEEYLIYRINIDISLDQERPSRLCFMSVDATKNQLLKKYFNNSTIESVCIFSGATASDMNWIEIYKKQDALFAIQLMAKFNTLPDDAVEEINKLINVHFRE